MGVFQERLKQVMGERNVKAAAIAKATGISTATISKYLSDENKKHNFIYVLKIANYLDVSPEWLGGATDERKPFNEPSILDVYQKLSQAGQKEVFDFASYLLRREEVSLKAVAEEPAVYDLPLLGKTAAGPGVVNGNELNETVSVRNIPHGADFALVVKGDSMEPIIKDGSIVFVKHQETVENGEIAIIDMDGEVTCKKVYVVDGQLELRSLNPKYKPMFPKQARIVGKVIL